MTHLRWTSPEGDASLINAEGDRVALRSTVAAPPGARLDGILMSEPQILVQLKVHSVKRQEDGSYVVTARLVDATKELLARLHTLVGT